MASQPVEGGQHRSAVRITDTIYQRVSREGSSAPPQPRCGSERSPKSMLAENKVGPTLGPCRTPQVMWAGDGERPNQWVKPAGSKCPFKWVFGQCEVARCHKIPAVFLNSERSIKSISRRGSTRTKKKHASLAVVQDCNLYTTKLK